MGRHNIKRHETGRPVEAVAQGEESKTVVAHVSCPDGLDGYVTDLAHANEIWLTATGQRDLHQTARARGIPAGSIGYIHSTNNVLLAVSRLDAARGTIELVGGAGSVNAGQHNF
jgi:hypothetical protein